MSSKSLLARFYHEIWKLPDDTLVADSLERCGGPLLDLGCASGRALEMALRAGHSAYGIDLDSDMLAVAQDRLSGLGGKFHLIQGDFVEQPYPQDLGVVTCLANTLGLVTERTRRLQVFQRAFDALRPGGRFLVWVQNHMENPEEAVVLAVPTADGLLDVRLSAPLSAAHSSIRIYRVELNIEGGHKEIHEFPTAVFDRNELAQLARDVGFSALKHQGDFLGSPFSETSPFQILLLEKPR